MKKVIFGFYCIALCCVGCDDQPKLVEAVALGYAEMSVTTSPNDSELLTSLGPHDTLVWVSIVDTCSAGPVYAKVSKDVIVVHAYFPIKGRCQYLGSPSSSIKPLCFIPNTLED